MPDPEEGVILDVPAGAELVCEDCGEPLEEQYVVIDALPFCVECVELEDSDDADEDEDGDDFEDDEDDDDFEDDDDLEDDRE